MRLLLKTKEQILAMEGAYNTSPHIAFKGGGVIIDHMIKYLGKYIDVTTDSKLYDDYDFWCEQGYGYKKEWFVWDHEILKSIKKCLESEI